MNSKVSLKSGEEFTCLAGQTILEAAIQNGYYLEHSCKTGKCGACAVSCKGETITKFDETHEPSKRNEKILTCARIPSGDVYIDTENLAILKGYPSKTIPARIDSITMISSDVVSIVLRTPPNSPLKFISGQYINVIFDQGIKRSYSIANSPRSDNLIELQIRKVENGVMSEYWFNNAKVNDLLRLEGPLGSFFIRSQQMENLIFLATGTGIAPVKAMLETLDQKSSDDSNLKISLFWGGRIPQDLYWEPIFENLNLDYYPVLSRFESERTFKGYVQDAVLQSGIDLSSSVVYSCGSIAMIESAEILLKRNGLNQDCFYSDAFVSSN